MMRFMNCHAVSQTNGNGTKTLQERNCKYGPLENNYIIDNSGSLSKRARDSSAFCAQQTRSTLLRHDGPWQNVTSLYKPKLASQNPKPERQRGPEGKGEEKAGTSKCRDWHSCWWSPLWATGPLLRHSIASCYWQSLCSPWGYRQSVSYRQICCIMAIFEFLKELVAINVLLEGVLAI